MEAARAVGLHAIRELEMLKGWVREQGMIPPRKFILATEVDEKALVQAIPFSSSRTPQQQSPQ